MKPTASGTGTGISWDNASGNLQAMINIAPTQIWVATGVYSPGPNRGDSFAMKNGVAIYGGFAGSETSLSQRVLTYPANTTLTGNNNNYHVVRNPVGLTNTAVLDGFVITGGNATAATASFPDNSGGGMFNNGRGAGNSCSPLVRNCLFLVNGAENGGAMYNDGSSGGNSSPLLANCLFERNLAFHALAIGTGGGGAIYNNGNGGNANFSLTNCSFLSNRAINGEGGAIYNNCNSGNARASLTNCSFQANRAKNLGYTIFNDGSTANTGPTLTNCVLWDASGGNTLRISGASVFTVRYSLFDSRINSIYYTDGPGNLKVASSPFPSTTDTRLPANSPANNVGDPASTTATVGATDLGGNPRISGGRIDMGAYEFQNTPNFPLAITTQPEAGSVVCAGSSVTASVSVTGTVTGYQWFKDGTPLNPAQTSATLSLTNAQAGDAGSYSVVVTGANNSVTSNAFSLTVNALPTNVSLTSNGPLTCARPSVTLTATGGSSYNFSAGASQIGGSTGNTATVTAGGTYTVTVANASGCRSTTTTTVVSNTVAPTATLTASSLSFCAGTSATLTAGGGQSDGSGSYTFSAGASQIGGSTGNTATVTAGGTYTVTVASANGCTSTTTITVTLLPRPDAPTLTATSRTVFSSSTPLSLTPFISLTGNPIRFFAAGGAELNPPNVDVSTAGVQSFSATQTNASQCQSLPTPFSLTVLLSTPDNQTSCRSSSIVLTANALGTRYEWYKNGQSAPFKLTEIASIQKGTATASLTLVSIQTTAKYYCKVFDATGSFQWSGPFTVTIDYSCVAPGARQAAASVGTGEPETGLQVVLAPNPVEAGLLRAVVTGAEGQPLRVSLTDLKGQVLGQQNWPSAEAAQAVSWDISQHPAGLYLLRASTDQQGLVVKVIHP
ncbi:MAG: T9SS type A sorting domain-containing protein [Spirosoma sp.]|nr:T9SS type A sorting domain-containing protein [Spirosoma sp.]